MFENTILEQQTGVSLFAICHLTFVINLSTPQKKKGRRPMAFNLSTYNL